MSDYKETVNSLREHADLIETSIELYGPSATRLLVYDLRNAAAAIEALEAKAADYEDTLKRHQKEFAELRAMVDDANARLEVGKAGNQYTLIEPKNKRYTLRCPKCGTVVGLMEVQDG